MKRPKIVCGCGSAQTQLGKVITLPRPPSRLGIGTAPRHSSPSTPLTAVQLDVRQEGMEQWTPPIIETWLRPWIRHPVGEIVN